MAGVVLLLLTCSATQAQLTIIPQNKVQEAANPTLAEGAQMQFDGEGILNFGTIEEDCGEWHGEIRWREKSGQRLTITRIQTSCSCLKVSWERRKSSNASSGVVGVTYLPKGHAGVVDQKFFVYTTLSESHPTAIVRVKGKVTPSTDRSGDYPHSCGTLLMRSKEARFGATDGNRVRIAVMNGGSSPLRITHDNTLSLGGVKAYTEPEQLNPGEEGDLVVEYPKPRESNAQLYLRGVDTPPRNRKVELLIDNEIE